jgi:endo-beta-N-acetylglucosaminidase D
MVYPDGSKIVWGIGRKLGGIISTPDDGPTPAQRLAKRIEDQSKGFAYFDTFNEVLEWTPTSMDHLQQANTPLVAREVEGTKAAIGGKPTDLILCHDYKGGYMDYESVRPGLADMEMYSCEYLQSVDTFIYFSHKLVCIPPPTWTNLLHRNGVKVLGTFIVEPQTPDIERMLERRNGRYIYAEKLGAMTRSYGFDGWLLNLEKKFSSNRTEEVLGFIQELKENCDSDCQVIWYDALDRNNKVEYYNGLSDENVAFAMLAGGFFTNYKWTEKELESSMKLAKEVGLSPRKIYFGIDVWAQNTDMPGPPRVTYPPKGGGGTNTGLVSELLIVHVASHQFLWLKNVVEQRKW